MIVYTESPVESPPKLRDLVSEFGKAAWYKVNIKKLKAFLYTNNEIPETEVRKKSDFFLVSYSDISLYVYKNPINFWILTLYTTTLLNSLTRLSSFLVESLGFSLYTMMSSVNNDTFNSSFPIWMLFISFSCLITVAVTPSTMFDKTGEEDSFVFFLILRGKLIVFACWV